jgi:hypothetical protein
MLARALVPDVTGFAGFDFSIFVCFSNDCSVRWCIFIFFLRLFLSLFKREGRCSRVVRDLSRVKELRYAQEDTPRNWGLAAGFFVNHSIYRQNMPARMVTEETVLDLYPTRGYHPS